MSKFQLDGTQRDIITSLAIHQDADGLVDFIQDLVDVQVSKGAPPSGPTVLEQKATAFKAALNDLLGASNAS